MADEQDTRSPYERLTFCRTRLAAVRLSTVGMTSPLREAIDHCWEELMALAEAGAADAAAIDDVCARVDKIVAAVALLK